MTTELTGMGWEANRPSGSLTPPPDLKHTHQESGAKLCEIITFWSFLRSKSVNNLCKLLQLLGDSWTTSL